MIDTCQASSMYEKFYSPNILAMASSLVGEDSLSVRLKTKNTSCSILLQVLIIHFKIMVTFIMIMKLKN